MQCKDKNYGVAIAKYGRRGRQGVKCHLALRVWCKHARILDKNGNPCNISDRKCPFFGAACTDNLHGLLYAEIGQI